jgi:hypothetical protein
VFPLPTPEEARRALQLVTTAAVSDARRFITANAERTRDALLFDLPPLVAYYSDGSAALAADHYDDLRDASGALSAYTAEPVVNIRDEKLRIGALWTVEPLFQAEPDRVLALSRIAEVVQYETARPFRETITANTRRDPSAVGWHRVTSGKSCSFCSMLASRGAVYKAATARFASHPGCDCSAAPVFDGQPGPEASALQYVASKRTRTPREKQALRDYLASIP